MAEFPEFTTKERFYLINFTPEKRSQDGLVISFILNRRVFSVLFSNSKNICNCDKHFWGWKYYFSGVFVSSLYERVLKQSGNNSQSSYNMARVELFIYSYRVSKSHNNSVKMLSKIFFNSMTSLTTIGINSWFGKRASLVHRQKMIKRMEI